MKQGLKQQKGDLGILTQWTGRPAEHGYASDNFARNCMQLMVLDICAFMSHNYVPPHKHTTHTQYTWPTWFSARMVPCRDTVSGITLDAPSPVLNLKQFGQLGKVD